MGGVIKPESREVATTKLYVTARDKMLLLKCWQQLESQEGYEKHVTDMGVIIFANLFRKYPAILDMFEAFKDDGDWIHNKHFLHHCKIFVNIIGSYIKLLNREEEMFHHVEFLARQHIFFPLEQQHFDLAKVEFLVALETHFKENLTADLREAWSHLYDLLSKIMVDVIEPYRKKVYGSAPSQSS
jgi:hemoglobin-like flavoprotein